MNWITLALLGYFFLALVNIGDKLFLGNFVPNYKVYTSFVGVLGLLLFLIAPWFLFWPGFIVFIVSIVSGMLFIYALLTFFYSLQVGEASRVVPFVGGLIPIFSLVLSVIFLNSTFTTRQLLAFLLLIVGTTLIVRMPHRTHWWEKIWEKVHPSSHTREILIAVLSSILFAASFVSTKFVYEQTEFLNGFIWIRLGSFLAVAWLLTNKHTRQVFKETLYKLKSKTGVLFLGNQGMGAIGFTLQSAAISLGSVALVNALQGVQYVFVIALAAVASLKWPKLIGEEKIDKKIIIEKLVAVIVIGLGLWVLAV